MPDTHQRQRAQPLNKPQVQPGDNASDHTPNYMLTADSAVDEPNPHGGIEERATSLHVTSPATAAAATSSSTSSLPKRTQRVLVTTTTTRTITTIRRRRKKRPQRRQPKTKSGDTSPAPASQSPRTSDDSLTADGPRNESCGPPSALAAHEQEEISQISAAATVHLGKQPQRRQKESSQSRAHRRGAQGHESPPPTGDTERRRLRHDPPSDEVVRQRLRDAMRNLAFPLGERGPRSGGGGLGKGGTAAAGASDTTTTANRSGSAAAKAFQLPPPSLQCVSGSSARRELHIEWFLKEKPLVPVLFYIVEWTNGSAAQAGGAQIEVILKRKLRSGGSEPTSPQANSVGSSQGSQSNAHISESKTRLRLQAHITKAQIQKAGSPTASPRTNAAAAAAVNSSASETAPFASSAKSIRRPGPVVQVPSMEAVPTTLPVPITDPLKGAAEWSVLYSDPPGPGFLVSGRLTLRGLKDGTAIRVRVRAFSRYKVAGHAGEAVFFTTPSTPLPPMVLDVQAAMDASDETGGGGMRHSRELEFECPTRSMVQSGCRFQQFLRRSRLAINVSAPGPVSLRKPSSAATKPCARAFSPVSHHNCKDTAAIKSTSGGTAFLLWANEAAIACGQRCCVQAFLDKFFPAPPPLASTSGPKAQAGFASAAASARRRQAQREQRKPKPNWRSTSPTKPRGLADDALIPVAALIDAICDDGPMQRLLAALPASKQLLACQRQGGTDNHMLLGGTRGKNQGKNRQYFTALQGLQNLEQPELTPSQLRRLIFNDSGAGGRHNGSSASLVNGTFRGATSTSTTASLATVHAAAWMHNVGCTTDEPPQTLVLQVHLPQHQQDVATSSSDTTAWKDVCTVFEYKRRGPSTVVAVNNIRPGCFVAFRAAHQDVSGQRGYASPYVLTTTALPQPNVVTHSAGCRESTIEADINLAGYRELYETSPPGDSLALATIKKYLLKFKTKAARFGPNIEDAVKTWLGELLSALGAPAGPHDVAKVVASLVPHRSDSTIKNHGDAVPGDAPWNVWPHTVLSETYCEFAESIRQRRLNADGIMIFFSESCLERYDVELELTPPLGHSSFVRWIRVWQSMQSKRTAAGSEKRQGSSSRAKKGRGRKSGKRDKFMESAQTSAVHRSHVPRGLSSHRLHQLLEWVGQSQTHRIDSVTLRRVYGSHWFQAPWSRTEETALKLIRAILQARQPKSKESKPHAALETDSTRVLNQALALLQQNEPAFAKQAKMVGVQLKLPEGVGLFIEPNSVFWGRVTVKNTVTYSAVSEWVATATPPSPVAMLSVAHIGAEAATIAWSVGRGGAHKFVLETWRPWEYVSSSRGHSKIIGKRRRSSENDTHHKSANVTRTNGSLTASDLVIRSMNVVRACRPHTCPDGHTLIRFKKLPKYYETTVEGITCDGCAKFKMLPSRDKTAGRQSSKTPGPSTVADANHELLPHLMPEIWHCPQCRYDLCPPCFVHGAGYGAAVWTSLHGEELAPRTHSTALAHCIELLASQCESASKTTRSHRQFRTTPHVRVDTDDLWPTRVVAEDRDAAAADTANGVMPGDCSNAQSFAVMVDPAGHWDDVHVCSGTSATIELSELGGGTLEGTLPAGEDDAPLQVRVRAMNVLGGRSSVEVGHECMLELTLQEVEQWQNAPSPRARFVAPAWLRSLDGRGGGLHTNRETFVAVNGASHGATLCSGDEIAFGDQPPSVRVRKLAEFIDANAEILGTSVDRLASASAPDEVRRVIVARVVAVEANQDNKHEDAGVTCADPNVPVEWQLNEDDSTDDDILDPGKQTPGGWARPGSRTPRSPAASATCQDLLLAPLLSVVVVPQPVYRFLQGFASELEAGEQDGGEATSSWLEHECVETCADTDACRALRQWRQLRTLVLAVGTVTNGQKLTKEITCPEVDILNGPPLPNNLERPIGIVGFAAQAGASRRRSRPLSVKGKQFQVLVTCVADAGSGIGDQRRVRLSVARRIWADEPRRSEIIALAARGGSLDMREFGHQTLATKAKSNVTATSTSAVGVPGAAPSLKHSPVQPTTSIDDID